MYQNQGSRKINRAKAETLTVFCISNVMNMRTISLAG